MISPILEHKQKLGKVLHAMPDSMKRNRDELVFHVSPKFEQGYRDELKDREPNQPSCAFMPKLLRYAGIDLTAVPGLPDGCILLTKKENLI